MKPHYSNIIANLSEHLRKNNLLKQLLAIFNSELNLTPRIGVEIEFYIDKSVNLREFNKYLSNFNITKEKGENQFELNLTPSIEVISYISEIEQVRSLLAEAAIAAGGNIILKSKPYSNDYGNSMHFHIDFLQDFDIELASNSLCFYILSCLLAFMPNEDDYLRCDSKFMAPTHVSRGYNNRSCAIRIPATLPKRIEHRVSSALCDPYVVIFCILKSILFGFKNPKLIPAYPVIYGNAYDEQYGLPRLAKNIEEAEKKFDVSFVSIL